jgi:hypothetical protein
MLTDFISGVAFLVIGGVLILIALPSRRRRRRRKGQPQIAQLRSELRKFLTIVLVGAGLLSAGIGVSVVVVALAGFSVGLI